MTETRDEPHQCFTVSGTAYIRNLDHDDLRGEWSAIHYQSPPKKTEGGMSFGLRFPMLILANYVEDAPAVAEKVAAILNKHWDDVQ